MKKKHIGIIICAVLVVVAAVVLTAVLHRNSGEETGTQDVTPTATLAPTTEPTAVPTEEPTKEPTMEPTEVPTPLPTEVPTATPVPTATSTPTPEPSPTPTATPVPTTTSTPTPTATPTPAEPTPVLVNKKNGEVISVAKAVKLNEGSYAYVYENGDVQLVNNNTGYAEVYRAGVSTDISTTDLVAKMTEMDAYFGEDFISKMNVSSSCMPTPTPTPTPFPTPNPEQPKKLASYKGDKDYGDVTVEAWDNGYMYVKGSGILKKHFSMSYCPQDLIDYWATGRASGVEVTHIIIEEGITEIEDFPYWANNSYDDRKTIEYIEFPPTLTKVGMEDFNIHFTHDVTVVGYKDGQKFTYILKTDGNILSKSESLYDIMVKQFGIR